jgi:hypothetical protein
VDELSAFVSAAISTNDPLDPWLTESHWDEHYWDAEAREIAQRLAPGMDTEAVGAIITQVLGEMLGSSADGAAGLREQSRRVHRAADSITAFINRREI